MHILRKDSCWTELLSWWRRASTEADGEVSGSVAVRRFTVYTLADADYTLQPKGAAKDSQLETITGRWRGCTRQASCQRLWAL